MNLLEPADYDLLVEVLAYTQENNRLPIAAAFRATHKAERQRVLALVGRGLLGEFEAYYTLTIAGLRALAPLDALAGEELARAEAIYEGLRAEFPKVLSEGRGNSVSTADWAKRIGFESTQISRAVVELLASKFQPSPFNSWSYNSEGLITTIGVAETIAYLDPFEEAPPESSEDGPTAFRIRTRDFRVLEELDWQPEGVCLLAGSNGAGKSTVLKSLVFLRDAMVRGLSDAVRFSGGADNFRRLAAPKTNAVVFEAEGFNAKWRLEIPIEGHGIQALYREQAYEGTRLALDVPAYAPTYTFVHPAPAGRPPTETRSDLRSRNDRPEINTLLAFRPHGGIGAFYQAITGIRVYNEWSLLSLRSGGFEGGIADGLLPNGGNVFTLLKDWRTSPRRFGNRFDWVLKQVQRSFPGIVSDIEFHNGRAAFYPADAVSSDDTLSASAMADGLLVGLLVLTAVAAMPDGGIVAFDEFENHLHPYAIRSLLASMRERAAECNLTVILTTHSPILMNAFHEHPEQFYVIDRRQAGPQPIRLTDLHDADWLSAFSLGDLYDQLDFGAPASVTS